MPELRKDPVVNRWVIISPERAARPQESAMLRPAVTKTDPCPFCAGNEQETPPAVLTFPADNGLANSAWSVRVVPNKYPALSDGVDSVHRGGIYEARSGIGVHEVIVESPEHVTQSQKLSDEQFTRVLHAFSDRIHSLRRDPRWGQVLIYKNQGADVGATLDHVHAQLIALPIVPRDIEDELAGAKRHYDTSGRCIYCDMTAEELRRRDRLVMEEERFIVFCPFASRFAYEMWILPRHHGAFFESETQEKLSDLARVLRQALMRLDRKLGNPPFNYIIHSSPFRENTEPYYHWHIEILPKLAQVAGFEWGAGWYINTVAPEHAAAVLAESFA
jgi:UDPglucose--hexose-1-phosphate uridylyltransferase